MRLTPTALLLVAAIFLASGTAIAAPHEYTGVVKCKKCHEKEDIGNQYAKWKETRHSKAMESLRTDKAKEWGKKAGVDDPATDGKCVKCHVAAWDVPAELLGSKYSHEQGVGCEACHGPGKDYKKKKVMVDEDAAKAAGLILPDEKVCLRCHNDDSPAFEGFDYKKALKKIAHPVPEGYDPYAEDDD